MILILIATIGFGITYLFFAPRPQVVGIGEAIELSPEQDGKTARQPLNYMAGVPWKSGTVCVTVDQVQEFASLVEAGIDEEDCSIRRDENRSAKFLLLQVTMKNIDAALYNEIMFFDTGHLMPHEAFEGWNVLNGGKYFTISPIYFSDHSPMDETSKDYWQGKLAPGESKTFQIGFFISAPSDSYILNLGTNGIVQKYGIRLGC